MKWWRDLSSDKKIMLVCSVLATLAALERSEWLRRQLGRIGIGPSMLDLSVDFVWAVVVIGFASVLWRLSNRLEQQETLTSLLHRYHGSRLDVLEVRDAPPDNSPDSLIYRTHEGRDYTFHQVRALPDGEKLRLMKDLPACWEVYTTEATKRMLRAI